MQKKTPSLRKALIRLGVALALIALAVSVIWLRSARQNREEQALYDAKIVAPTCTDSGYTLYTHKETGETYIDDVVPATGHSFGQWSAAAGADLMPQINSRSCSACQTAEEEIVYPALSIPVIALEGDLTGIAKKTEVPMQAQFQSGERSFSTYASLKYQGHGSLTFDKKNYTLKFWKDEKREEKYKMEFSHWNPENKYILKANYIDPTGCRNLVCADVWAQVTANRAQIPEEFKDLSNYGAVDGFPVALYINRQFQGLYNMNLHKDDDLFGMSDEQMHAILIANNAAGEEAYFRAAAEFGEDSPWEVEFCGTQDSTWAKDKLNGLIDFVMHSDDATFRRELDNYLDVDSTIDYLLSIYALGLTHHGASDLVLVCYSEDAPFTASMYDMETAFGLSEDGLTTVPPEAFLPVQQDGMWNSGTGNLLWDRLMTNFYPQLCARYAQLRQTVFAPEALCAAVTDFTAAIPEEIYLADGQLYPGLPGAQDSTKQINGYIMQRIALLDEIFLVNEDLQNEE